MITAAQIETKLSKCVFRKINIRDSRPMRPHHSSTLHGQPGHPKHAVSPITAHMQNRDGLSCHQTFASTAKRSSRQINGHRDCIIESIDTQSAPQAPACVRAHAHAHHKCRLARAPSRQLHASQVAFQTSRMASLEALEGVGLLVVETKPVLCIVVLVVVEI